VISHIVPRRVRDRAVSRVYEIYDRASEQLHPRTAAQITRLLDGFELIEPEVMARHARLPERAAARSTDPIGWRVLARKP
jgi:hypothetical protein